MRIIATAAHCIYNNEDKFNADIAGNGDGITMGDALEIQQRLLNSAE